MPKLKNHKKAYIIQNAKGYNFGAFPRTKEGLAAAKEYIKTLEKTHIKEKFKIKR